jgi:hypothetical protein
MQELAGPAGAGRPAASPDLPCGDLLRWELGVDGAVDQIDVNLRARLAGRDLHPSKLSARSSVVCMTEGWTNRKS